MATLTLKKPEVSNGGAVISITVYSERGKDNYQFSVRSFYGNLQPGVDLGKFFFELLKTKLGGMVNELPASSKSGSKD